MNCLKNVHCKGINSEKKEENSINEEIIDIKRLSELLLVDKIKIGMEFVENENAEEGEKKMDDINGLFIKLNSNSNPSSLNLITWVELTEKLFNLFLDWAVKHGVLQPLTLFINTIDSNLLYYFNDSHCSYLKEPISSVFLRCFLKLHCLSTQNDKIMNLFNYISDSESSSSSCPSLFTTIEYRHLCTLHTLGFDFLFDHIHQRHPLPPHHRFARVLNYSPYDVKQRHEMIKEEEQLNSTKRGGKKGDVMGDALNGDEEVFISNLKNSSNRDYLNKYKKDLKMLFNIIKVLNLETCFEWCKRRKEEEAKEVKEDEEEELEDSSDSDVEAPLAEEAGLSTVECPFFGVAGSLPLNLLNDAFLYCLQLKYDVKLSKGSARTNTNVSSKIRIRHKQFLRKKMPQLCVVISFLCYFLRKYKSFVKTETCQAEDPSRFFHVIDFAGGNGFLGLFIALIFPNVSIFVVSFIQRLNEIFLLGLGYCC
jgi:hypothetical protein